MKFALCASEVVRDSEVCDACDIEEKNSFVALYNFLSACYNLSRKQISKYAGMAESEPQGGDRIERRT